MTELLRRVQHGEFPQPQKINPNIPKSLEAICLKAMSLSPAGRYESAADIAEDIENWLADKPVAAKPEMAVEKIARHFRKSPVSAAVITYFVMVDLVIGGTILSQEMARGPRYFATLNDVTSINI